MANNESEKKEFDYEELKSLLMPVLGPLAQKMGERIDIGIELDRLRVEREMLELEQKRTFSLPSEDKFILGMRAQELDLRRSAARGGDDAEADLSEADAISEFIEKNFRMVEDEE